MLRILSFRSSVLQPSVHHAKLAATDNPEKRPCPI